MAVETLEGIDTTVFSVEVARIDIGKLIGQSGRTVVSLRMILSLVSRAKGLKFLLDLVGDLVTR
ncbi:KH domain-containing protein [Granulicella paludicola]|uniref:KH domain-containing protein n=1 Tax=Granulicella paludicola TaxID=474951 RepID=UPI0021E066EF|nr:KH domain-containing protein [Granulicella paludicola]